MIKECEKVCSSGKVCLVDGRKFLDGMKHQQILYAFIPREDKEGSSEVQLEVLGLLSEYGDVIFDNVPEGLPQLRKISHQIYLVHIASFPNKATHKMTRYKTGELNTQV